MSEERKRAAANYGIQANQVSAEVLAVGENARASKIVLGPSEQRELHAAVVQLQESLKSFNLPSQAKITIDEGIESLRNEASKGDVNIGRVTSIVQNLSGKLKAAGIVTSEIVALAEPLQKLAGILRIPLHFLGL